MHLVILTQVLDRDDAVLGFFHGWCETFAGHVDRLTVFAQRVGRVDLPDHVDVRSLGKESGGGRWTMLRQLWSGLASLRGAARPDAVLAHMVPKFVLYAAPLCKPRGVPMYLWYTHKGVDRNLRMAVPMVKRVFTASELSFRMAGQARRVEVTGHGIDCEHFAPGPSARSVDVLAVGRLAPSKGQDELLAALTLLERTPRVEIAGDILLGSDAPFRDGLAAFAKERLPGAVRFLGAVSWPEVADAMRRARVLVNTSRTGSLDKVVLEAMACGTVPLTCNESFAPVFGAELSSRLMFPQGDPAALADALQHLLALPDEERAVLGARMRELVLAEHDLRRLIPRLLSSMGSTRGVSGEES
jgi:glycosyltransferase involved in cell wall biosynthesis